MTKASVIPKWHRVLAVIASMYLVGAGQVALGRYLRALSLIMIFIALTLFGSASEQFFLKNIIIAIAAFVGIFSVMDAALISPSLQVVRWRRILLLWIAFWVASLTGGCFIKTHQIELFCIPSSGMAPTLQVGDYIMVNKTNQSPHRGEIIVFVYPIDPDKDFIKRVIAVGGDTVQLCGGQVLLNGQPLRRVAQPGQCEYEDYDEDRRLWSRVQCVAYREWNGSESYLTIHNQSTAEQSKECTTPVTIPTGHVFVLGDNRDNSHDSRYWGTVPLDSFKGKASFIWWSKGLQGGLRSASLVATSLLMFDTAG